MKPRLRWYHLRPAAGNGGTAVSLCQGGAVVRLVSACLVGAPATAFWVGEANVIRRRPAVWLPFRWSFERFDKNLLAALAGCWFTLPLCPRAKLL